MKLSKIEKIQRAINMVSHISDQETDRRMLAGP